MYAVNVRLDNGEYRTVVQDSVYDLRVGNRVRMVDGRVYRYWAGHAACGAGLFRWMTR
jgi:outer membrane lipoprotein SlyB